MKNKKAIGFVFALPLIMFLVKKAVGLLLIGLGGFIVYNSYQMHGLFSLSTLYAIGTALLLMVAGIFVVLFLAYARTKNEKWQYLYG